MFYIFFLYIRCLQIQFSILFMRSAQNPSVNEAKDVVLASKIQSMTQERTNEGTAILIDRFKLTSLLALSVSFVH